MLHQKTNYEATVITSSPLLLQPGLVAMVVYEGSNFQGYDRRDSELPIFEPQFL